MNSTTYDKIVDYLMQFRGQIPSTTDLNDSFAIAENYLLLTKVDELIKQIDRYALMDGSGWIK